MDELVTLNFDSQTMSARELHEKLNVKTAFKDWFPRMCDYGFEAGKDFRSKMSESTGGRPATDYEVSIPMAKELCMIQRTPEGKAVRQYLIKIEEAWNTPEMVIARGLAASQKLLEQQKEVIQALTADNERMKPKEIFADAVTASDTAILMRDLAKLVRQNGVEMGERRLYKWMRDNGYIIKNSNQPTQRAMEMGLFELTERTIQRGNKNPISTITTKVTGKGQQYFVNKFLGGAE